jgi:hypothetical protein
MVAKGGGILFGGPEHGAGTAPMNFNPNEQAEVEEQPNASPEEQKQYDLFIKNAMELMYTQDGKAQPEVLQRLSTGNKPIDSMAQTVVWLTMLVEQDAERNGMHIEDDVLFHASTEILEQLVELAEAAGLHEYKEAEMQGAWYQALDMYREANTGEGGRIDTEAAAADFEALRQADAEGRGDEVLPGYEQQSERAIAMAMADQNTPPEEEEGEEKTLSERDMGR